MNEQGTLTVWALALCLMLFLLGGISVDVWRAFDARRTLTDIADTAARNGANEINVRDRQLYNVVRIDTDLATQSAEKAIQDNSQLNAVVLTSRDIDINSATNEVTVELHSEFSFFLLGFLPGATDADLGARATARPFEG